MERLGPAGAIPVDPKAEMTSPSYSLHPLCRIFPMGRPEALTEMTRDIVRRGLQEPIALYQGRILDGKARYMVCGSIGVPWRFTEYAGDDPVQFVVEKNLTDRALTTAQRSIAAAKITILSRAKVQNKRLPSPLFAGFSYTVFVSVLTASKWFDVSPRSIKSARAVIAHDDLELTMDVENGSISLAEALRRIKEQS